MENYETLSNRTRDLEQKYISYIIEEYNNEIIKLSKQIEEHKKQKGENSTAELENEIKKLQRKNEDLTELLENSEKKFEELSKNLQTNSEKGKKNNKKDEESNLKMKEANSKIKDLMAKIKLLEGEISDLKKTNESKPNKSNDNARKITKPDNLIIKNDIDEIKGLQKEILKSIKHSTNSSEGKMSKIEVAIQNLKTEEKTGMVGATRKLKEEVESLRMENEILKSKEKMIKEYEDKVALLKDSVESKNRAIEAQQQQIKKLNEKLKKEAELSIPPLNNPFEDNANSGDPWALNIAKTEPIVKKKKDSKKEPSKKMDKPLSVENIIRNDNQSFFNNLSFGNSSPIAERKKNPKNFK